MLQCGFVRWNFSLAIGSCGRLLRLKVKLERVAGIEPAYSAWKAAALPLCYTRLARIGQRPIRLLLKNPSGIAARGLRGRRVSPLKLRRGGGSRTRTCEGVRQGIYSPPP